MSRKTLLSLGIMSLCLLSGCVGDGHHNVNSQGAPAKRLGEAPRSKKWTVMVYMAADNSLSKYSYKDIDEMKAVGSTDDVNVVVLWDNKDNNHGYYYIEAGNAKQLTPMGDINMGDPKTAKAFLDWSVDNYPAEHYAYIFWNHGQGPDRSSVEGDERILERSVCTDESAGKDRLTEMEQNEIMEYGIAKIGKKFDFVGFDACLMGCAELYYQYRNQADYMCASQMTEPGNGWDYKFLQVLKDNPDTNGETLARAAATYYAEFYKKSKDATISVADLSKADQFAALLDDFCKTAMSSGKGTHYKRATIYLKAFASYTKDLSHFMKNVEESKDIPSASAKAKAKALREFISREFIIQNWTDATWKDKAFGVAITMTGETPVYAKHFLCRDTQWSKFGDFVGFVK